jgi:vancomycin resistance protein YoaR
MKVSYRRYAYYTAFVFFISGVLVYSLRTILFTSKSLPQHQVATVSLVPIEKPSEKDLLGKAELSYAGGTSGRNKNIEIGASRIDGKVIPPGGEFSFIKALGDVTEEGGFSNEKVFLNGEVTKGIGGGLCQVSTTLFRSVLEAGLPVSERHNHSYTVSRYDMGLDATYSDPGVDFKFINDMAYPVVVRAKTEDQKVIIELRGVSDGRIASTTEPEVFAIVDVPPPKYVATTTLFKAGHECVNTPQIGYTAKLEYNILYGSGIRKEQTFSSTYKPLQRICYFMATSTP